MSNQVSKKVIQEVYEETLRRVKAHGGSQTGACKSFQDEIGVSFVTIYNIISKKECSKRTYAKICAAGWMKTKAKANKAKSETIKPKAASYTSGVKQGYNSGYKAGYDKGIADISSSIPEVERRAFLKGKREGARESKYDYIASPNSYQRFGSSHMNKLEKLMKLDSATDSAGESVAAKTAAAKILTKILAEHPDFSSLNLNVNLN